VKNCVEEEKPVITLEVSDRQVDEVTVVDLSGQIVLGTASNILRQALRDLLERGQKKILLNMANVKYVDSSGLGALVGGLTVVESQQGQLKLVNLTPKVRDLLQITKTSSVFEVFEDEATAIISFS